VILSLDKLDHSALQVW